MLTSDGVNVTAYDHTGTIVSGQSTDGGSVLGTALALLTGQNGHITFRNDGYVFPWIKTPWVGGRHH
jgi:hypothetical protein